MGMTDNQFNGFIGSLLGDIPEVLNKLPEGEQKDDFQKIADK